MASLSPGYPMEGQGLSEPGVPYGWACPHLRPGSAMQEHGLPELGVPYGGAGLTGAWDPLWAAGLT